MKIKVLLGLILVAILFISGCSCVTTNTRALQSKCIPYCIEKGMDYNDRSSSICANGDYNCVCNSVPNDAIMESEPFRGKR